MYHQEVTPKSYEFKDILIIIEILMHVSRPTFLPLPDVQGSHVEFLLFSLQFCGTSPSDQFTGLRLKLLVIHDNKNRGFTRFTQKNNK
jgi:hypothetical protein